MLTKISSVVEKTTVATGVTVASLSRESQIAIAICASIGTTATASAASSQSSSMLMQLALDTQIEASGYSENADECNEYRDTLWNDRKSAIIGALHDAANQRYLADLKVWLHVKGTKDANGEKLEGLQSLLKKADTTIKNYCSSVESAWALSLSIESVKVNGVGDVVETIGKLRNRIKAAKEAADTIRTEGRETVAAIAKFSEDMRVSLLGKADAPKVPDSVLCAILTNMMPKLTYAIMLAEGGSMEALDSLTSIAVILDELTDIAPEETNAADSLPEGETVATLESRAA